MTNVFKATYIDQYTQTVNLQPGIYTFQALVYFHSDSNDGKYSISFTDAEGGIFNINLNWQVEPNTWCMVTQTFELEKTMVLFSLMASPLFTGEYILIGLPQAEEGESKSTPRANPLDDTEELKGEIDLVRSFISSQVDILEDRIVLKVGEYQIGGKNFLRNFDGRFGTDFWGEGVELVDENGDPIPVHILSVTAPNPISVYVNSTPEIPETIKLVLDNGSSVNVPVDWGVIDTSVVGEQSIQGIYELPEGVTGDMPDVFLKVLVVAITVVSVTPLAQVTVDQYRIPVLPTTIQLNLNNQTSIEVPVTWGEYSTNTAGTFELTAIYDLPSGISGYKPTVKMTLVVNEVIDTGTFIDLKAKLTNLYDSGVDEVGAWVRPNNQEIKNIVSQITSGVSVIYIRKDHIGGAPFPVLELTTTTTQIGAWVPSSTTYRWALTFTGSPTMLRYYYTNMKIYSMELRNDGSVPPWYIE
jgi:hypothetical protein